MGITKAERFHSDHELVVTGRVKAGLHRVEGFQIEGVHVLCQSPARREELRMVASREALSAAAASRDVSALKHAIEDSRRARYSPTRGVEAEQVLAELEEGMDQRRKALVATTFV